MNCSFEMRRCGRPGRENVNELSGASRVELVLITQPLHSGHGGWTDYEVSDSPGMRSAWEERNEAESINHVKHISQGSH